MRQKAVIIDYSCVQKAFSVTVENQNEFNYINSAVEIVYQSFNQSINRSIKHFIPRVRNHHKIWSQCTLKSTFRNILNKNYIILVPFFQNTFRSEKLLFYAHCHSNWSIKRDTQMNYSLSVNRKSKKHSVVYLIPLVHQ